MVTLITEKLRSQTLDDVQFEPISQRSRLSSEIKSYLELSRTASDSESNSFASPPSLPSSASPPASDSLAADHDGSRQQSQQQHAPPPDGGHSNTSAPTRHRHASVESGTSQLPQIPPPLQASFGGPGGSRQASKGSPGGFLSSSSALFCELSSTPPAAPPLKRHCRSLSIPGDCVMVPDGISGCHGDVSLATVGACGASNSRTWQPQASAIWKPVVALRQYLRADGKLSLGSSKMRHHQKNRHSSGPGVLCTVTHSTSSGSSGSSGASSGSHGGGGGVMNVSGLAPGSADSGHTAVDPPTFGYRGGGGGLWSVASSDSFSTPPESPVPRPASASSGFYDSSQSSLNNAPWLDPFVGVGMTTMGNTRVGLGNNSGAATHGCHQQRSDTFKIRSFSMEEPISVAVSRDRAGSHGSGDHTRRTVDRVSSRQSAPSAAGSMPVLPACVSTPSSPRRRERGVPPRCRSQPCDLQDAPKCGLKRRRDDERPTLDFYKMKETAYDRTTTTRIPCSRPKNVQFAEKELRSGRILPSIFTEPPECFLGLNTIASSPLDNNTSTGVLLPALSASRTPMTSSEGHLASESARHPRSHRKHASMAGGSSGGATFLPGDVFPELSTAPGSGGLVTQSRVSAFVRDSAGGHPAEVLTRCDTSDEDDAELVLMSLHKSPRSRAFDDDEDRFHKGWGERKDHANDRNSDASFNDDDDDHNNNNDNTGVEQVFQLDMNNEIDLEQIEKD